jgi:hypothetical protein
MTGQTGHTPAQTGAVPARIELEDFIEALTPEAQDEVHRMRAGATVAAPIDDAADVAGFRAAEYEDEFGYKGRPGTGSPLSGWSDGERTAGYITLAAVLLITAGFL